MTCLHFVLECLFYISGIALAAIAGIGLRQLTITRDIARTDAKRQSLKLAADQCHYFVTKIIPDKDALDEAIKTNNIAFFAKSQVEVKDEQVKVTSTATPADVAALRTVGKEFLLVFNAIDAFALFFIAGVADEQVAFSAFGQTYCNIVRQYLPELVIFQKGAFNNALQLFFLWNSRLESQRLTTERQDIDKKLQEIQNKFIRPVGT